MTSLRILCAAGLVLAAVGCGDDDGGAPDAGPLPVDQCLNPTDLGIAMTLLEMTDGGLPDGGVPDGGPLPGGYGKVLGDVIQDCAEGACLSEILMESGVEACMATCLSATPADGLSSGCTNCYIEVLHCAVNECLNECLGADQQLCDDCTGIYCSPRLFECSGLPGL
jgi:hypothetical protein